jgi:glycosyltransferase involved in cell wall biosynthesis
VNILHVNTHNTGGAAKACLRAHLALLSKGVDSKVLLRSKTQEGIPHVHEIWEGLSYAAKSKKYLEQKKLDLQQNKIRKQLLGAQELFSFPHSIWDITSHPLYKWADTVHLHWVAGFLDYPSFFNSNDKKIAWTIHDEEPFSEGFHYHHNLSEFLGKEYMNEHIQIKKRALRNQPIQVISPSNYLLKVSQESDLFSPFPHHEINNCANTSNPIFDKEECRNILGLPADKKIALYVADDFRVPRKGFKELQQAWESVSSASAILCIVGSSTSKADLQKGIISIGRLTSELAMNQAYSAADVLITPSLIDNFPNTILEATCCGTPTIGFNVGGIPQMINEINGTVCEPDVLSLSKAILNGLESDWDRAQIKKLAESKYNYDLAAKRLMGIYEL